MASAVLPILVWAAHFTVIYGFTALACARSMAGAIPWVVGLASLIALAGLIALALPARRTSSLTNSMTLGLGGLAAIAVVWETSSLLWVPLCG